LLAAPVGDKTFQAADGYGLFYVFEALAYGAVGLALGFLGADSAANCRQEVRLLDDGQGGGKVAVLDFSDKTWYLYGYGAAFDTGLVLAAKATLGFPARLLFGVA
jgi:hypothetical protein